MVLSPNFLDLQEPTLVKVNDNTLHGSLRDAHAQRHLSQYEIRFRLKNG